MKKVKYGLVLSGGGTKGSYEVGVLKALKKLKIDIDIVSGASIGTINAIFLVQNEVNKLENLYKTININNIIGTNNTLDINKNIFNPHNLMNIANDYIKYKGVSNEPLKELLYENVNIKKINKSNTKFCFMVYDTKKKSGKEIYVKDFTKEKLIDYVLASSCFPIYKKQEIDGKLYMDGGLYDNMPIDILTKKGYKNIIVVDISGIGIIKKNNKENINYKLIKPDESLGGTFDFNKETIEKNIKLGYLDTLKVFHKLQGIYYYFDNNEYIKLINRYTIKQIIGLEEAALIYNFDRYKIYNFKEFITKILERYESNNKKYKQIKKGNINIKVINEAINKGYGISLCIDILNNYPSILNTYSGLFSNYLNAARAIIEIKSNINTK